MRTFSRKVRKQTGANSDLLHGPLICEQSVGSDDPQAALSQTRASPRPVTLRAADGVSLSGLVYEAVHPKALILLFHQADSSKGEYDTIAPHLARSGFLLR